MFVPSELEETELALARCVNPPYAEIEGVTRVFGLTPRNSAPINSDGVAQASNGVSPNVGSSGNAICVAIYAEKANSLHAWFTSRSKVTAQTNFTAHVKGRSAIWLEAVKHFGRAMETSPTMPRSICRKVETNS